MGFEEGARVSRARELGLVGQGRVVRAELLVSGLGWLFIVLLDLYFTQGSEPNKRY